MSNHQRLKIPFHNTLYAVRRMQYVEVSSDGIRYVVVRRPSLRGKSLHISLRVCYNRVEFVTFRFLSNW